MAEGQLLLLHDSFFLRCQECGDHLTFPFLRLLGRIFVSSASGSGNRDNDDDNATLQYRSQYCNVVHGSMLAHGLAGCRSRRRFIPWPRLRQVSFVGGGEQGYFTHSTSVHPRLV